MKLRKLTLALALPGLAAAAFAGEEIKTRMAIAVVDSDDQGEVRLELDSDDLGFNLQDMQEGENRSIVDDSGRTILLTREADGFRIDVEGKTITLPLVEGDHTDVDVHVMHDVESAHSVDGVMIISDKPIDEATQQAIKSMLESAGHGSDVRFIDSGGADGGPHAIKVIEKTVEVSK